MADRKTNRFDPNAARAGLLALRSLQQRFARRSLMRKTQSAIDANLPWLMRLRLERVTLDANGSVAAQAWADEVIYFIRNQIQPLLTERERQHLAAEQDRIAWMIADRVEEVARRSPVFYRFANRANA
jgi:hypothetical protein